MTAALTVGTRIYRPVRAQATGAPIIFDTPVMQHFDDGTVMLRAVLAAGHWQVGPWEAPRGRVCVCDEPIPLAWTYFEVLFADVNFVAVSPVAGDPGELGRKYQEATDY